MMKLIGTEKQVRWACEIREKGIEICKKHDLENMLEIFNTETSAEWFIEKWKCLTSEYKDYSAKCKMLSDAELRYKKRLETGEIFSNGIMMEDGKRELRCRNHAGDINRQEFKLYRFRLFDDIYKAVYNVALKYGIEDAEELEENLVRYLNANRYDIKKSDRWEFDSYEFKAWKNLSRKDWFSEEENSIIYAPAEMTYTDVIDYVRKKGKEIKEEYDKGLR